VPLDTHHILRLSREIQRRSLYKMRSGKETLMHQAAARYWNEIATSQPLKTEWAQQMFPLLQEDMDLALENDHRAISNYLLDNPSLRGAIPPIETIAEAIMIARKDFRLTTRELQTNALQVAPGL